MADGDQNRREPLAVRRSIDVQQQDDAAEDRLTSLPEDLFCSVVSFLPVRQCVALSAVCSDFRRRLPSLIPRFDAVRLDIGVGIPPKSIFPRAMLRQCHIFLHGVIDSHKRLQQIVIQGLAETGVQDLIVEFSYYGWFGLAGRNIGFFGIGSLRSLCLRRIRLWNHPYHSPSSSIAGSLLTSLRIEYCSFRGGFLRPLLTSCPFLETLQLIRCRTNDGLRVCSASLKHLVLLDLSPSLRAIDISTPQLESLIIDVVTVLRIEAPKAQTASFLLDFQPPADPSVAWMKLFRAAFRRGVAWFMLNSSKTPNKLAAENGINKCVSSKNKEGAMIFQLDFNLKDQSSTAILTDLLKKCNNCKSYFDIRVDSTHIQNAINAPARDDPSLRCSTEVELIELRMAMPERRFEGFISNRKKMKKFKHKGLEMLRSRTSREQFMRILASEESLFRVSSSIAYCIEMKF